MTAEGSRTEELLSQLGTTLGEPSIAVVGCGGAGSNVVNGIYWKSSRVDTVAVNTDEEHLRKVDAHKKVLIGKDVTFGKDAGGFPEVGEHCAEKAKEVLKEVLRGYDMVFVVAGMGGGTGTGVAPMVASIAKELNAVTFALPILPFEIEGEHRMSTALTGIEKLKEHASFTVVLDNNKLMSVAPELGMSEAMKVMDRSVMRIVDKVVEQTTSYVSTLMEDVSGYMDAYEEQPNITPPEIKEQLVHAELDPMFGGGYGSNMFV